MAVNNRREQKEFICIDELQYILFIASVFLELP